MRACPSVRPSSPLPSPTGKGEGVYPGPGSDLSGRAKYNTLTAILRYRRDSGDTRLQALPPMLDSREFGRRQRRPLQWLFKGFPIQHQVVALNVSSQ